MADELDKKLKQIADMFGVQDTASLKNIVESIVPPGSGTGQGYSPSESGSSQPVSSAYPTPAPGYRNNAQDLGFLTKVGEMLSMFNNVSDSRITLLNSVQPFLGPQRKQRIGGAIQLLKVIAVISSIAPQQNRGFRG